MSQKQQIWNFLLNNNKTTMSALLAATKLRRDSVTQYIIALRKAAYVKTTINIAAHGGAIDKIVLIKNTGATAPMFTNGLVTDVNIKQEIVISKKNSINIIRHALLIKILEAILKIDKEEFSIKELCKELSEDDSYYPSRMIMRWIKLLEKNLLIADSKAKDINSRIMLCNRERIRELLPKLKTTKNYKILLD